MNPWSGALQRHHHSGNHLAESPHPLLLLLLRDALNYSYLCCAAPNILAGLSSKGERKSNVGMYGTLGPAGFSTTIFAASRRTQVPQDRALPTTTLLGVSSRAQCEVYVVLSFN